MIISAIISTFLKLCSFLISLFPFIDFGVSTDFLTMLSSMMAYLYYFFPVNYLVYILSVSIALDVSRMGWQIILRIKSFVPMWGN